MSEYKDKGATVSSLKTNLGDFASDFLDLNTLRSKYNDNRYGFVQDCIGISFSDKIHVVFNFIMDRVKNKLPVYLVLVGPRGSGKTYQMSAIEMVLWYFDDADCVNAGGSEGQAQLAYNYIDMRIHNIPEIKGNMGEWLKSRLTKKGDPPQPFIEVLTASPKSLRGPHPGGARKSPGCLFADEVAEMEDGLIFDALPQINTAAPPVFAAFSTFHNAGGDFAELYEKAIDADEFDPDDPIKGSSMLRVSQDTLDINVRCTFDCNKCFDDFRTDFCKFTCGCRTNFGFIKEHDPKVIDLGGDGNGKVCSECNHMFVRKAKANKYGWMRMEEIFWAYINIDKDRFLVDWMGRRPSISGYVLPINKLPSLTTDKVFVPMTGDIIILGLDWGYSSETAIVPIIKRVEKYFTMEPQYFSEVSDTDIMEWCKTFINKWTQIDSNIIIKADSSHPFQNTRMRNEFGLNVREVNFSKEKEVVAGILRWVIEQDKIMFSNATENGKKLIGALKRWKRGKDGLIKKNPGDHPCDAWLCSMADESMGVGVESVEHIPVTIRSNQDGFWEIYGEW